MNMLIHSNKKPASLEKFIYVLDAVNGRDKGIPATYHCHMQDSAETLGRLRILEMLNGGFTYGPQRSRWTGPSFERHNDYACKNQHAVHDISPRQAVFDLNTIGIRYKGRFSSNSLQDLIQYTVCGYYPSLIGEIHTGAGISKYYTRRNKEINSLVDTSQELHSVSIK
jgi:hypothetical protein